VDQFGRDEIVGVHPSREVNAVGSTNKVEIPDEGSMGAVVRQVHKSLDIRARVRTASEAIGEPGDAEDSKDKSSYIVREVGPMELEDVSVVLDSVACSRELEDTCVGDEMAMSSEESPYVYTNDVVGECLSGSPAAPFLSGVCTADVSNVPRESEYVDEVMLIMA